MNGCPIGTASNYYCAGPAADVSASGGTLLCAESDLPFATPWVEPTGPVTGFRKILRGGNFVANAILARSSNRATGSPNERVDSVGFRCCRSL